MPPKNKENHKSVYSANAYLKYSGLAIQMGIVIGLGAWLGIWLDGLWQTGKTFTVIGSLLGVFLSLYRLISEVLHENPTPKNKEDN